MGVFFFNSTEKKKRAFLGFADFKISEMMSRRIEEHVYMYLGGINMSNTSSQGSFIRVSKDPSGGLIRSL